MLLFWTRDLKLACDTRRQDAYTALDAGFCLKSHLLTNIVFPDNYDRMREKTRHQSLSFYVCLFQNNKLRRLSCLINCKLSEGNWRQRRLLDRLLAFSLPATKYCRRLHNADFGQPSSSFQMCTHPGESGGLDEAAIESLVCRLFLVLIC